MISYQKKFLRFVECWNGEAADVRHADIVRFFQQHERRDDMLCREFHTVLIDLTQSSDTIFTAMRRGTRYEIRRAEASDNLDYKLGNGSDSEFDQFCSDAAKFLSMKGQPGIEPEWLRLLSKAGLLEMTQIADANNHQLVWHAYHRSTDRATLLYSVPLIEDKTDSARRALMGRANRLLHWQDIMHFKTAGLLTYDFGGWYPGSSDAERLRINKFKEQFGGKIVKNYICEQALTAKGALFLKARTVLLGDAI
jgi:hypothetical protein